MGVSTRNPFHVFVNKCAYIVVIGLFFVYQVCKWISCLCVTFYRLLKAVNYQLRKDLTDKFSALELDSTCLQLNTASQQLGFHKDSAKIPIE